MLAASYRLVVLGSLWLLSAAGRKRLVMILGGLVASALLVAFMVRVAVGPEATGHPAGRASDPLDTRSPPAQSTDPAAVPSHQKQAHLPPVETLRPRLPADVSLLLITIDSMRWNGLGFMGYERNTTPNIDQLVARGGVVYDRAYGLGSYTGQAIPPMLTGKYASELKRNDQHEMVVYDSETFAAELVCSAQVRCGAVLSHFLFLPQFGWHQGFRDWKVVSGLPAGADKPDLQYSAHAVTDEAIRWFEKGENTVGRFWFWAHYMDPHKEYLSHDGIERFGTDRRAQYDHEVRFTDHHLGRLLRYFMSLPAAQRTLVVLTADHGEAFGEHGLFNHGWELWDEIIRVPLAVVGPGITPRRIARPTSHIDLFPTIIDLFGVPIPQGVHGRSLLGDWGPGQELPARPIVADQSRNPYFQARRVFIQDGWKLHHQPDTGTFRLYRLDGDYERGSSVAEAEPGRFSRLKADYEQFLSREFRPVAAVKAGATQ